VTESTTTIIIIIIIEIFFKVLQLDLTTKSGNIFHTLENFLVDTYISKAKGQYQIIKLNPTNLVQYIYFKCMQIMLER
jgi:hypothetical protein